MHAVRTIGAVVTCYDVSAVPLQGGYLAKQCPVRAQKETVRPCDPLPVSPLLGRRFARDLRFEEEMFARLLASYPEACMVVCEDQTEWEAVTVGTMQAGAPVILRGRLLADPPGRRVREPDLLVAADGSG